MAETSGISFEDILKVAAGKEATAISRLGLGDLPGTLESLGIVPEERERIVQQAGKDVFRLIAGVIHPDVSVDEKSEAAFRSLYGAYQSVNSDPKEALREHVLRGDDKLSPAQSGELAEIRTQVANFAAAERRSSAALRYRMPYYSLFGIDQDESIGLLFEPSITSEPLPPIAIRQTRGGNPALVPDDYRGFDIETYEPWLNASILVLGDSAQVQGLKIINPSLEHVPARVFNAYCKKNADQIEEIEDDIASLFKSSRIIGSDRPDYKRYAEEDLNTTELDNTSGTHISSIVEILNTPAARFRVLDRLSPFMERTSKEPAYLAMARRTSGGDLMLGIAGRYTVAR